MSMEDIENVVNDTRTLPYCCRVERSDEDVEAIGKRLEARWGNDIKNITFLIWCLTSAYQRLQVSMGCDLMECRKQINLRNIEIERLRAQVSKLEKELQDDFLDRNSQSGSKS